MAHRKFEDQDHVSNYSESRPRFSSDFYEEIISYLSKTQTRNDSGKFELALDVGCGTGHQSTYQLSPYFRRVIGLDVSPAMIERAKASNNNPDVEFRVSSAENLPVESGTASLVTAATALHWFDFNKFYVEVDRVLAPGGVIAAFCREFKVTVVNHPNEKELTRIYNEEVVGVVFNRGHNHPRQLLQKDRYMAPEMQIPFSDRIRRDDLKDRRSTTIKGLIVDYLSTASHVRKMRTEEPEFAKTWHQEVVKKFLEAYGTNDINSRLDLEISIFLIMGHKPVRCFHNEITSKLV